MTGAAAHGVELARFARAELQRALGGPAPAAPRGAWADAPGATFVTLRWRDGALQGCIGSLEPRRALAVDVARNAVAAGLEDPRARALRLPDVDDLSVEVSILSPLSPIPFDDEAGALAALRPGVDGVVFEGAGRRATFLPAVWETLPEPRRFLQELKRKAGLPASYWGPEVRLQRYTVEHFEDAAP